MLNSINSPSRSLIWALFFSGCLIGEFCFAGQVFFVKEYGTFYAAQREGLKTPRDAVLALLDGLTEAETSAGITSAIAKGTTLKALEVFPKGVEINLSEEAGLNLDDQTSEFLFLQFFWTMEQFGKEERVRILIEGQPISNYIKPLAGSLFPTSATPEISNDSLALERRKYVVLLTKEGNPHFVERVSINSPQDAIAALLAGATEKEAELHLTSAFPPGTTLLSLGILQKGLHIDLSEEMSDGIDEVQVEQAFEQIYWTLAQFGLNEAVRLSVNGEDISLLLQRDSTRVIPTSEPDASQPDAPDTEGAGIFRKRILLSALGGYFWDGHGWTIQSASAEGVEPGDFVSARFAERLKAFLEIEGASVSLARDLRFRQNVAGVSGYPRWQESSYVWLFYNNLPCAAYASFTGLCDTVQGKDNRRNDDIRATALAGRLNPGGETDVSIFVAVRDMFGLPFTSTDAPNIATFYAVQSDTYGAKSVYGRSLANAIQHSLSASLVRSGMPWATSVSDHAHGSCIGQLRLCDQPSALVQMSSFDPGILRDSFLQSLCAWAVCNGISQYYGVVPRWEMFSAEALSEDFPDSMVAGEGRNVKLIFRNKSVQWDGKYGFALVAVDGSDPFAAPLFRMPKELTVDTDETYTWTMTIYAPDMPGTYVSDWQMFKDGFGGFGDVIRKEITVVSKAAGIQTGP